MPSLSASTFSSASPPPPPPPPNVQVLQLVSALSNPQNHLLHVQAIQARDLALSSSQESYNHLCVQLAYLLVGCDRPVQMLRAIEEYFPMEAWWRQMQPPQQPTSDLDIAIRNLQIQMSNGGPNAVLTADDFWIRFGQTAGFALKQALLHPPQQLQQQQQYLPPLVLTSPASDQVKETLLFAIHSCQNTQLKSVASSIIATTAVSVDGVQPALHILAWPQLVPNLLSGFPQQQASSLLDYDDIGFVEGPLATVRKMMEDGPTELDHEALDLLFPPLIQVINSNHTSYEKAQISALQAIHAGLDANLMPSALVVNFASYLTGLSTLAASPSTTVRQWVCRSLVALLCNRTEYLQSHLDAIVPFILSTCQNLSQPDVALDACEFWFTFASLEESCVTPSMSQTVEKLLPPLIPMLVRGMVYLPDQQLELRAQNELDQQQTVESAMQPVFHRNRSKRGGGFAGGVDRVINVNLDDQEIGDDDQDDDDNDDDDDEDGGEGSEWTLRKCSAASLDALANMYGPGPILPPLLPALEEGLSCSDPWVQEASILALGAVAEGCRDEMHRHMPQLFPYLLKLLATPETPENLPQLKCIAAWTIGRYASWAVDQVQTGTQGHLLAQIAEAFLQRLPDRNRKVQVACCSAFAVVIEAAGDLMAPYLEPTYRGLVEALLYYQGRSLLVLFDTMGVLADFVGPAIGEDNLPAIYVPAILQIWGALAKQDPSDRKLLPLLESLASMAITCGVNFQPFALEAFENAICTIEVVTLMTATTDNDSAFPNSNNDEDSDPIICATDLLDGLVEGLGANFIRLLASSQRYGPTFPSMLYSLLQNDVPGVRMSALALLGDLARQAPSLLESHLPQFLQESIQSIDPIHPSVCSNAVWAVGEICVRCVGNPAPLEPFAPLLLQSLIPLFMGNGVINGKGGRGVAIPGLLENAAAATGRLAKVNPNFVAPELPRFLLGWCDGMAKISDPTERRDAFEGFIQALYANPNCIRQAGRQVADAVSSVLFAIVSWHMPLEAPNKDGDDDDDGEEPLSFLHGEYTFYPFPATEAKLGESLRQLMSDMKVSVGEEEWRRINQQLPVNVRRLLREAYQL